MADMQGYKYPDELYYHSEHGWAREDEDGIITIGMTDFAQQSAGEIAYMDMPMEGDELKFGETAAKIQTAKWIGKLLSPVSGEVIEVNEDVQDEPQLINEDPFGEGWIVKVKATDWEAEKAQLMRVNTPEMAAWLQKEIERVEKEIAEAEGKG